MSYKSPTRKNKHQKVNFKQYLANADEPRDYIFQDAPIWPETELVEDTLIMKRNFRNVASELRQNPSVKAESLRIEHHLAELQRNDIIEMSALDIRIAKLKTSINLKRRKQGLLPIS